MVLITCYQILASFPQHIMIKAAPLKAIVVRINLLILASFLLVYASLMLWPSSSSSSSSAFHATIVSCTLRECRPMGENNVKMKAVLDDKTQANQTMSYINKEISKRDKPDFLNEIGKGLKIGTVNMKGEDLTEWNDHGKTITIAFEKVSENFEWKDLFPEWIDEEEELEGPASCPEIPMPNFEEYDDMDVIVAKLPCKYPEQGWNRDVFRVQVHLIVANLLVKKVGGDYWNNKRKTKVIFLSKCLPMLELFRCSDLVRRDGDWWYYEAERLKLEHKVSLPVGSCNLALPLWGKGIDQVYDVEKLEQDTIKVKREAYATVLHSSEAYVCGAITLAQSLLRAGTKRHLILLIDNTISAVNRAALNKAGWQLRFIKRIRNPKAEKNSYNEYNYSKFRLWQLTDYDKIIFIDSDIIILKNLDVLFHFPQMSAAGNDGSIFNSGIMVIEPSNCTFKHLMKSRKEIVSYNGGDQGFLNEIFVWWHRLPRRVNFLKNFWSNSTVEVSLKNHLFGAKPPKVYGIHYLGLKPWACYRDYDCNWDIINQRVYASDVAHERWWKVHDSMDGSLQRYCGLSKQRRVELDWERKQARAMGFHHHHSNLNITDPRRLKFNLLD